MGITNVMSEATDIRRNGDQIAVGLSWICGNRQEECPGHFVGTWWDEDDVADGVSVNGTRTTEQDQRSRPHGINDDANVYGWVWFRLTNQAICHPTAVFWESPSSTSPVDLGGVIGGDFSRAFAINNFKQVVGRNEDSSHAILWVYDPGCDPCWIAFDLDDSENGVIAECSDDEWRIFEAHDINDNGWIVALGDRVVSTTIETHALLMTPEPCPLDVDNDGFITEDDAAAIAGKIFAYDPPEVDCPVATICDWDVNFDCIINEDDHAAVLDYIENCEVDPCPCEGGSSFASAPGEGLSIERYMLALAALEPELTTEQAQRAWESFFNLYYQYH
jgi:hypothetical protein